MDIDSGLLDIQQILTSAFALILNDREIPLMIYKANCPCVWRGHRNTTL